MQLERRAVDAEAMQATAPVAGVLRLVIEELQALDGASAPAPPASRDLHLLTAAETAAILRCSRKWLYRNRVRLPFARRVGRAIRFDSRGLETWLARLK